MSDPREVTDDMIQVKIDDARLADLVAAGRPIDTELTKQHAARTLAAMKQEIEMAEIHSEPYCASQSTMTREDSIRFAALDMALRGRSALNGEAGEIVQTAAAFEKFLRGEKAA